jgi:hypothetical protein
MWANAHPIEWIATQTSAAFVPSEGDPGATTLEHILAGGPDDRLPRRFLLRGGTILAQRFRLFGTRFLGGRAEPDADRQLDRELQPDHFIASTP